MARYSVKQVAQIAGVSVRALHHYDEIGLLAPGHVGENGYRYYGRAELERLQQILIHRELDIPLIEIAAILDAPAFDRLEALQTQRARLEGQQIRLAEMLETIDRTIAELKGDGAVKDDQLYSGMIDPQKQAEYESWLAERYGPEIEHHIAVSRAKMDALSPQERAAMMDELKDIETALAQGLRTGIPPQSRALDPVIARHWAWVRSRWNQDAPVSAYGGLADTYLSHPDFIARYEAIEVGFARYLATAMKAWVNRQG